VRKHSKGLPPCWRDVSLTRDRYKREGERKRGVPRCLRATGRQKGKRASGIHGRDCHPEHSEGSHMVILRFAQNDKRRQNDKMKQNDKRKRDEAQDEGSPSP
jgi:hypothetical protein